MRSCDSPLIIWSFFFSGMLTLVALCLAADPFFVQLGAHVLPFWLRVTVLVASLCLFGILALRVTRQQVLIEQRLPPRTTSLLVMTQGFALGLFCYAGTSLHYLVPAQGPNLSQPRPIRTLREPGVARFAFLGDSGAPNQQVRNIVQIILDENERAPVDGVFLLGDNVYRNQVDDPQRGFEEAIESVLGPIFDAGIPVFALLGNHDFDDPEYAARQLTDPRLNMNGSRYYSARFGESFVNILLLDSELAAIDSRQSYWLQKRLAYCSAPWKIILCHKPMIDARNGSGMVSALLDATKLEKVGVAIFIAGDTHHYQRHHTAGGVVHLVNGGASKSNRLKTIRGPRPRVFYDETESFVMASFTPTHADFRAINHLGQIVDEFRLHPPGGID